MPSKDANSSRRVPLPAIPDMVGRLADLVAQIPSGHVSTPGRLAEALGDAVAARWVGHYLLHHEHSPDCACHRVVRADGQLGPFVSGENAKKIGPLLEEGISIAGDRVDVDRFAFDDFVCDRPLATLRAWQQQVAKTVSTALPSRPPASLAAVDVSYGQPHQATAAFVLFELSGREPIWSHAITRDVVFPYISSYLAFRELPIYVELLDEVRTLGKLADVVLVDGSGILHPRRAGSASCLGVVTDMPTVGVTKKLLCGRLENTKLSPGESCRLDADDTILGAALRSSPRSKRPIYVSPGHKIDVETALELVRVTVSTRRLPDPIYWADRMSRETARMVSQSAITP